MFRSRSSGSSPIAALAVAVLGLAAPSPLRAANPPSSDTLIVSTDWVAERLGSEELVILHVGRRAEYDVEHLPGAHYVSFPMIAHSGELTLQVRSVAQLDSVFESLGVSDDSRIVVYFAGNWATPAARLFVTLDYLGLGARTSLMDGGLEAWKAEGRPVTREPPQTHPGSIEPQPRQSVIATAGWLQARLNRRGVAVVDARTPEYYAGARGGHAQPRAGHIAGAGNVPFTSVLGDGLRLKSRDALERMFAEAGVAHGDTVVTYCHIGQQASLVYLTARYLGYPARLYDGSFEEWSRRPELAVERPAAERLAKLISTEELAARLDAGEELSIVDLRSDFFAYLEGHIPGAVYLHYETLRATQGGVPADILDAETYARLFSQLGISHERPVVVYASGAGANFNATFLAWILVGFDHPSVHLLDGGFTKWAAEGRAMSRDYPTVEESNFAAEPFDPHLARLGMVRWTVENAGTERGEDMVLVDVRPVEQYSGRAGAQVRRGHIPGAINHVWSSDLAADGDFKVWKSVEDLRASYEAQGITPDKHVILYCNTGTEASHVYFALRNLLEYPTVDVYFPSWTEWSARPELPVSGPEP